MSSGLMAALEKIDVKAEAALCQMTHGGTRAFCEDIRQIVAEAATAEDHGRAFEASNTDLLLALQNVKDVLQVLQQYPGLDDETMPFGNMIAQALADERPALLDTIDSLAGGLKPRADDRLPAANAGDLSPPQPSKFATLDEYVAAKLEWRAARDAAEKADSLDVPTKEMLNEAIADKVARAEDLCSDFPPHRAMPRFLEASHDLKEIIEKIFAARPAAVGAGDQKATGWPQESMSSYDGRGE